MFYIEVEIYFQALPELFFYSLGIVYNKPFILKFPKKHIKPPTKKNTLMKLNIIISCNQL